MTSGFRRKASFLAAAGVIEYALQLLLPIVLVRYLDKAEFGEYRLTWLIAATSLIFFSLYMPQSLFYFLPRAAPGERPKIVGNVLVSLIVLGALAAFLLLGMMPFLPSSIAALQHHSPLVPVFVGLWTFASVLNDLPNADGRAEWQACAVIAFAIVRLLALAGAAIGSGDIRLILVVMCGLAIVKAGIAVWYALFSAREPGLELDRHLLRAQLRFSLPFAMAEGFFALRLQADQWVVAAQFSSATFALISIASVVLVFGTLVRQPLNHALLPDISAALSRGDMDGARELISKGYVLLGSVLPPVLGWLILTADDLVELIYTQEYLGAVPLMQIYLLGQLVTVFAAGHLLGVFGYGSHAVRMGAITLMLSIALSIVGVKWLGVVGAVAGSTLSLMFWEFWALYAVAKGLGCRFAALIRFEHTGKVAFIVVMGVLVAHFACSGLDGLLITRVIAKSAVFAIVVLLGVVLTRAYRPVLVLLREPV